MKAFFNTGALVVIIATTATVYVNGQVIPPYQERCNPLVLNGCQKGDLIDPKIADCYYKAGHSTCEAINNGRTVDQEEENKCQPSEEKISNFVCGQNGTGTRCVCDIDIDTWWNECRCQYWPNPHHHVTEPITIQPATTNITTAPMPTIEPPINSTTTEPPKNTSTTTNPPSGNSTTVEPPNGNTTTIEPPNGNSTTVEPPNGNSTTIEPPNHNSTTVEPPNGNSTTIEPPNGNSTTIKPPNGNSTTVEPPNNSTTFPPNNSTTISPPNNNSTTTEPNSLTTTTELPISTTSKPSHVTTEPPKSDSQVVKIAVPVVVCSLLLIIIVTGIVVFIAVKRPCSKGYTPLNDVND